MGLFSKKQAPQIDVEQRLLIENAQKRIRQKKNLYRHFVVFLAGAIIIIVLNEVLGIGKELTIFGKDWFLWAILFWVFLLLIHAINVLFLSSFMNKKWEEAQISSLVQKQKDKISRIQERVEQSNPLPKPEVKKQEPVKPVETISNKITLIAAAAENNALGKDNDLPWHLPDDFKRFKALTTGHYIIMGRKTWESMPKPLPNRTHVVITRKKNYIAEGAIIVNDLVTALDKAKEDSNIFIIGGGEIYALSMDYATHIELTRIHHEIAAHVFFPDINLKEWRLTERVHHPADDRHEYSFSYETYIRKAL